jgi:hypothetical protein
MKDRDIRYFDDSKPVTDCSVSQCELCQHHQTGRSCIAFKHIPDAIWGNLADHRQAYPNDNGVRFEWRHDIRTRAAVDT